MSRRFMIFLLLGQFALCAEAAGPYDISIHTHEADLLEWSPDHSSMRAENPRVISALLAVALGPFGGHRIYLGTKPIVPIIYVATLGGGFFILPLIDLGHLLFTKDLSVYENHDGVFMWRKQAVTPQ